MILVALCLQWKVAMELEEDKKSTESAFPLDGAVN